LASKSAAIKIRRKAKLWRKCNPAARWSIRPRIPRFPSQPGAIYARQSANIISSRRARFATALASTAPFAERLTHFWANHFAVSVDKLPVIGLAGLMEFEAVRPHVFGRFADMLGAVERHPAMLLYLDQAQSIGPGSAIGSRIANRGGRQAGLNENLAREILELHTLGVRSGYSQNDVTEFARALTGFTVAGMGRSALRRLAGTNGTPGDFAFADPLHEPGPRTIMGKSFAQTGQAQADAVLAMLAVHPATARHLSTKLARHFVSDTPPPRLIAALEADWLRTGGDLASWYNVLIDAPEAWAPAQAKFKTPWEWTVSAARAAGVVTAPPAQALAGLMQQLGQPIWKPGSPAGYDDITASWMGPDALLRRVEVAPRLMALSPALPDARARSSRTGHHAAP